jgi:subtilisin family serine protease
MDAFDMTTGQGQLSWIVAAINYAVQQAHANVINMSFSLPANADDGGILATAIANAISAGVVVVASVPDFPSPNTIYEPAGLPSVTAVGCSDGHCPLFKGFGVGVDAPGYQVLSPYPGKPGVGRYALYTGTSFAAPFVTGTGALLSPANSATVQSEVVKTAKGNTLDVGKAIGH